MNGAWLLSSLLLAGAAAGEGGFGRLFTSPEQRAELERRRAPPALAGTQTAAEGASKTLSEAPAKAPRSDPLPTSRFNGYLRGPDCIVLWVDGRTSTAEAGVEGRPVAASPRCRVPTHGSGAGVSLAAIRIAGIRSDEIEFAFRLPDGRAIRVQPGEVLMPTEARVLGIRVLPTISEGEERR